MKKLLRFIPGILLFAILAMAAQDLAPAFAQEDEYRGDYDALVAEQGDYAYAFDFFTVSMLWTVIAAGLVFLMHLGFATLESGMAQQKNCVNILFKNVFIICIGLLTYAFVGFNTHYPGDFNGWVSIGGPIGDLNADGGATFGYGGTALAMTGFGDFIFQAMFAATAATIVSGCVTGRIKLTSFMIFGVFLITFSYPIQIHGRTILVYSNTICVFIIRPSIVRTPHPCAVISKLRQESIIFLRY